MPRPRRRPPPEEAGLFQDILDNPEDHGPRLVYADWLEDHGQPARAELIRVQCDLARAEGEAGRLRKLESWVSDAGWRTQAKDWVSACRNLQFMAAPSADPDEAERLRKREKELLREVGAAIPVGDLSVDHYLGLPHAIHGAPHEVVEHADAICRAFPTLALRLAQDGGYKAACYDLMMDPDAEDEQEFPDDPHPAGIRALAGHPILERCVDLELMESVRDEDSLVELFESRHLRNLRRFVAENCGLWKSVPALARSGLSKLTWLDLGNNRSEDGRVGDAELERIVTCPHLGRLEYLGFALNQVTNEGAEALARAEGMSRLRRLCLDKTPLGAGGVRALAHSPHLTSLDFLDLGNLFPPPGDAIVAALLDSPLMPRLRGLDLRYDGLTDEGLRMIGSSPAAGGLRSLVLASTSGHGQPALASPAGIRALVGGSVLANLRRLNIAGHPLDDEAARALAGASLPHMRELVVSKRLLTPRGLAVLEERFGKSLRAY